MAEKVQPALLLAHPTKKAKKRKPEAEKAATKKALDIERSRTRVNIGAAFERWRQLGHVMGLKNDTEVAFFLLDGFLQSRMCSVVGCHSGRRSAQPQRFRLPEDPERRLEWVQFLATVNKQHFKESSWTDIVVCIDHFKDDCFEKVTPGHSGMAGRVQLKPGAVPSLSLQSESEQPDSPPKSPGRVEPVEAAEVASKLQTSDGPTSFSEESRLALSGLCKCCKCPLCGSEMKVEKVTCGVLIVLNQQCLQCEYRNQWKSQVIASVPEADDQQLTGGTDVTLLTGQAAPTDDTSRSATGIPEVIAVVNEESDPMDDTEISGEEGDVESDEDWKPRKHFLPVNVSQRETEDRSEKEVEENDDQPPPVPINSQLCTDCGVFFNKLRPHTCEHKIKPYSCNICGKRCVSEVALNAHSRIHDESYEFRCKYCNVSFKTKVDKFNHEQIHSTEEKPYKCPDCSEAFPTYKERRIHLEDHRGPRQTKCHICKVEFSWPLYLQRHLPVHTGERPFKCPVCQRGFNQPGHLKSHMRLHTGERPYKCRHCDKCFNHNVSLKSHVQRYHASNSGGEQNKEKIKEVNVEIEDDTGEAEGCGSQRGADSELDDEDTEEELPKCNKRSTGRPIGRPKRNESDNLVLKVHVDRLCLKRKTGKQQAKKLEKTQHVDGESEDEQTEKDTFVASAEAEEERSETETSSKSRSRRKARDSDSDSDFEPKDKKKKKPNSQKSGKSSGKPRGRPRKNLALT
uniref:RE1-silencing transcription factor-like n=1 Tax=Sparus aurata TaxID=8175 RepID=A0A671WEV9_SPAAU